MAFPQDVVEAVCRHMDDDHADDALLIVQVLGGQPEATAARTTAVDELGIGFAASTPGGPVAVRVPFDAPATDRAQLRTAVVALHARAVAGSDARP